MNILILPAQQKIIDSLEHQLIYSTNSLSRIEVLNELSWYYAHSNTKKGIEKADEAIKLSIKEKDSLQLGIAYERKGFNYQNRGNDSLTISLYKLAEDTYTRIEHSKRLATLSFNMGNFYFRRSDYKKSLPFVQNALDVYTKEKDTIKMGRIYNQIGLNHLYLGDYTASLNAFQKGAFLFEQMNENKPSFYADIQGNLGMLYEKLSQYQTALEFQNNALKLHKKNDNQIGIANTYNNLGNLYSALKQNQKALEMFNDSYEIKKKTDNKYSIASALTNIGIEYHSLKESDKALEYLNHSKSIYEELGHNSNLSIALLNIGDIYLEKQQPENAKIYFDSAYTHAKKSENKRQMFLAKEGISHAAFITEDYKKAYTEQQEAKAIKESILSNEKRDEVAGIKAKYEYEKEKSILKADFDKNKAIDEAEIKQQIFVRNTSIGVGLFSMAMLAVGFTLFRRKKEADLNAKIVTSELQTLRAQMNPHFIFNTLNSINDYIIRNKKEEASRYLTRFSIMMRNILDNSKEDEVPLNEEIEFLETYIKLEQQRLSNTFTYDIIISDDINIEETLIPPSLLQPFIENSIWHGFSEKKGTELITIAFTKEQNMLICSIDDNGGGIDPNKNSNKKSFGTSSVQNRLDLLNKLKGSNSKIDFINKKEGVRVEIRLPLSLEQ